MIGAMADETVGRANNDNNGNDKSGKQEATTGIWAWWLGIGNVGYYEEQRKNILEQKNNLNKLEEILESTNQNEENLSKQPMRMSEEIRIMIQ